MRGALGVFYFQNAFDSKTQGVDLVATYPVAWENGQATTFTLSMNYNESKLASNADEFLNPEDQYDFENREPNWRGMFTARTVDPIVPDIVSWPGGRRRLRRSTRYGPSS